MSYRPVIFATALMMAWPSVAHANDNSGVNALYDRLSDAVMTADFAKVASIYGPDSVYLGAGIPPIVGRDSIASAFTRSWQAKAAAGAKISLEFRLQQRIWHGPDSATDIGYSKFSFVYDDKTKAPSISYSKFATLAQRRDDGSWAFRVDIDNKQSDKTGASEYDALQPVQDLKYDR